MDNGRSKEETLSNIVGGDHTRFGTRYKWEVENRRNRHRWTESDERRAVQKFRDWQGTKAQATVRIPVAIAQAQDNAAFQLGLNLIIQSSSSGAGNFPFDLSPPLLCINARGFRG